VSPRRSRGRPLAFFLTVLRGVPGALRKRREEAAEREQQREEPQPVVPPDADPRRRDVVSTPRRELLVVCLLLACAGCSVAFAVLVLTGDPVQLEGLSLGLALAFLAAALGLAGRAVVPQVTEVEERPQLDHPEEVEAFEKEAAAGLEGVSRRRLLAGAGLAAGGTLAAALAVPAASLGPAVHETPSQTPWRRGRGLVDQHGVPVSADDLAEGGFLTAFPAGADPRELGSPVAVVRVDPATLKLPRGREDWAPEGLLAFSKICTHAGCAVALFRYPLSEQTTDQEPALQCPCHYSVFAVRRAAAVTSGPAGRPLPQLPLVIAADRTLRAGGPLSGPVGPAWWGVRSQ
jgi:ubiquinol-cytochrome c reductase iron-sulfur subunit